MSREFTAREKVLLIMGFPLWFPLLVCAFAVAIALYAVLWALVLCLWAVEAALWACAPGGAVLAAVNAVHGRIPAAAAMLGMGLVCAGLAVLLFPVCKAAVKLMLSLTARTALWLKSRFI